MTIVVPYVVCEKNTNAMTLVDPYVVYEKKTHERNLAVVNEKKHTCNDFGGSICGL